jgi:hypothetical protein
MSGKDLYRDCFWCGFVYDIWQHTRCPECGSRLETEGIGGMAGPFNRRKDYNGPDYSEQLAARQAQMDAAAARSKRTSE